MNIESLTSLVFVLIFESFMNLLCDGFAVKDQAFSDGRLEIIK